VVIEIGFFRSRFNSEAVLTPEAHHMVQKKKSTSKKCFYRLVGGRVSKKTFWAVDFFRATVLIPEAVPYGK
jgi:hypothetical protein